MLNPFRTFISAVLTTLAILGSVTVVHASTLQEIKEASYIFISNGNQICSGQFVEKEQRPFFVTAAHCVNDETATFSVIDWKTTPNLDELSASVYFLSLKNIDRGEDVALFSVKDNNFHPKTVDVGSQEARNALVPGAPIIISHYPLKLGITLQVFSEGRFNGLVKNPASLGAGNNTLAASVNANAVAGSSGGGLYVEVAPNDWELVGTLRGGENDWNNYFTTIDGLRKVIGQ